MPGDQSVASVDHSLAGDGEIAQTVDVVPRSRIVRLLGQTADTRSEMNRICKVSRPSEPSRDLVENNVQHSQKRKYLSNGRTCTNHLLRDNMQNNNIKMSERLNELLFSRVSNIFPRLPCFCKTAVRSVGQPVVALFSIPGQPPELILAKDPLDSLFGYITNLLDVAMVTDNSRNVIRTIRVQPFTLVFSLFCLSTARPY